MTLVQNNEPQQESPKRPFLPLGSIVILKGSVKKLLIASRGSIVEGAFYDYGAFMYPEGMIDTNIAYFNHDNIHTVVWEGFRDADDELVLEILNDAYVQYLQDTTPQAPEASGIAAHVQTAVPENDDPFAAVRDLDSDDE